MLKDIDFRKVQDTAMAVVQEKVAGAEGGQAWNAYLINTGKDVLKSILVSSKGYGEINGQPVKTSQLRQFVEQMQPGSFFKVEEIREELLPLNNEFWVSFSKGDYLFDKKYVFVTEAIREENLVNIPHLDKPGVLII